MTPMPDWLRIGVYRVDESTGFDPLVPDLGSGPATSGKKLELQRQRRFRDAVPEYGTLLSGAAKSSLDAFHIACLGRWIDRWAMQDLRSLKEDDLRSYLAELSQKGHNDADVRREKGLLQSFYRWACRNGWADDDPTARLRHLPHLPTPRPVAWTGVEQRKLLDACTGKGALSQKTGAFGADVASGTTAAGMDRTGAATRAPPLYLYPLVLVGLRTGLRLGNLLNLDWRHVDFSNGRIVLPPSQVKTGRPVEVPLSVDACWVVREILRRAQLMPRFPRRIFDTVSMPVWKGSPDARQILHDFRLARKRARIPEGDFHSLRLSFLRNCARAGVPLEAAARMADWEDEKQLAEIYRQNSPPRIVGQSSW